MTLGTQDQQGNLLDDMSAFCDKKLPTDSIYSFLHRERDRLFPDSAFADLFKEEGRRQRAIGKFTPIEFETLELTAEVAQTEMECVNKNDSRPVLYRDRARSF